MRKRQSPAQLSLAPPMPDALASAAGTKQARGTMARGQAGEEAAARYLQAQGYRIIERNWRAGNAQRGEVDCIAWEGKTLCFVEVKTRASSERGAPQEAVNFTKQRQLSRLANAYVSLHHLDNTPCRFDVVEVLGTTSNTPPQITLHRNAFDYIESGSRARGSRIF